MFNNVQASLAQFKIKWHDFVKVCADTAFFNALIPTSVGWKVSTLNELDAAVAELRTECSTITMVHMNERWVAKCVLKPEPARTLGVGVVKVMQVRPDSTDALGLDHVDFYSPDIAVAEAVLSREPNLTYTSEANSDTFHSHWLSVWFSGTEAKIKNYTVLDISALQLQRYSQSAKGAHPWTI